MSIGENIRNKRKGLNMSQETLALAVHVSTPYICQIERGTKIPNVALGAEIAKVLQCDLNDLVQV